MCDQEQFSDASAPIDISIIVPVFNEADGIEAFHRDLAQVLDALPQRFEILYVDDGSKDGSYEHIRAIAAGDSRVRGISFSRNFGHQAAITAGIHRAHGRATIMMDADLQHPPRVIPKLIEKYREGFEVVYTVRRDTSDVSYFKRLTSAWFYRIINLLTDVGIEPSAADFRLLGPKAVAAYCRFQERGRFMRGLVRWMGFRQTAVEFEVAPRYAGASKYNLRRMVLLALDGITAFSSRPLRVSFAFGLAFIVLAMLYVLYAVYVHFTVGTVQGWTSILITVLIIGGVQLFSIGILGEYIGRVFNEVKDRPLYIVESETSTARTEDPSHAPPEKPYVRA